VAKNGIFRTQSFQQDVSYKKNKGEIKRKREERNILSIGTIPVTVHDRDERFNFVDSIIGFHSSICFPRHLRTCARAFRARSCIPLGNSRYLERHADELNERLFRPYVTLLLISKTPSSASNLSEMKPI
jgi:hypothetical protein